MAENRNKYSVYQGLDSDPQVNWGTVANTISKQLKSLRDIKVAERDAIEKSTQDQMDQLNKLPDVNDRSLNRVVLEASDNSKQYLLREADLVKRGLRKPKDYSLFLQSQKNGFSEFGNVVKNWDKWNTAKMEAIESGSQSDLDAFTAEDISSFGNLKDKTIMTNPANGQIQVVSMGKDGSGNYTVMPNALKSPQSFNAPGSINSRMRFNEKKRDTSELVNQEVKFIGQNITATRKGNGVVETIEDFTEAESYPKWKDASIKKLTSNDFHMTQILTGEGYVLGRKPFEEAVKDDETLTEEMYIEVDMSGDKPQPILSDTQKKAAKDIVGEAIDSQLGRKEDSTQEFKPTADDNKRIDKETNVVGFLQEMNTVLSDVDRVKSKQILDRRIAQKNKELKGADSPLITDVDITDSEIIVYYADGTSQPTKRSNTKDDSYAIFNFLSPEAGDNISTPVLDDYVKNANLNFGESNVKSRDQIRKDYPELLPEDKVKLLKANPNKTEAQLLKIKQEQLYQDNTFSSKASQKPIDYIKSGGVKNLEGSVVQPIELMTRTTSSTNSSFGFNDNLQEVKDDFNDLLSADGFLPRDSKGNSVFNEGDITITTNEDNNGTITFKVGSSTLTIDKLFSENKGAEAAISKLRDIIESEVKKINETRTGTKGRRQRAKETDTSKYNT